MMDREFTPREKGMLLVLAVLLLALGYMKLFYAPVQQAVEDNQQRQTELQDQALIEQTRALKMQVMEKELEELKAGNAVPDAQVPDYDNVQRVMIELNAILARAQEYSLAFDDVSLDDSGLVRRPGDHQRPVPLPLSLLHPGRVHLCRRGRHRYHRRPRRRDPAHRRVPGA